MARAFPIPCLDCGQLTTYANRCQTHEAIQIAKREAKKDKSHYSGDYKKRAKLVRDAAEICWICGQGEIANDPWTADHYYAGNPDSPLLPAHRSCNSRRGNSAPN